MTMSWNETSQSARPSRPTYLPPHLRDFPSVTVNSSASSGRASRFGPARGRGGGGGGGQRGRGRNQVRSWGQQPRGNFSDLNCISHFDDRKVDISEKFDELEVVEEDVLSDVDANAYDETPVVSSGFDVPPPVSAFSDFAFNKSLHENIKRCKFTKPTPIQCYSIPVAMSGRDLMACAQTGSGKTAAFCFPIISGILRDRSVGPAEMPTRVGFMSPTVACPVALILSPTRELSRQV